jgi:hypothetical protein
MGVNQAQRPQMYAALQRNFSRIYSSPAVTPAEVLAGIDSVVTSM